MARKAYSIAVESRSDPGASEGQIQNKQHPPSDIVPSLRVSWPRLCTGMRIVCLICDYRKSVYSLDDTGDGPSTAPRSIDGPGREK